MSCLKIVQINVACGVGSTGKICAGISDMLTSRGIENYILFTSGKTSHPLGIKYSKRWYVKVQALKSRIFGNYGLNSIWATRRLIAELERINPDIVHLHNIHSHDCNVKMLFAYLKKNSHIKILWTFHDCWAFTGYCPHYTFARCDRWKEHCGKCPQRKEFSWLFDRSSFLLKTKKESFSGMNMSIVTPSEWLAGMVRQSFLAEYPIHVINNGIDLAVFKPTESAFREKYSITAEYIILGVAFGWGKRKGLDVFIELAKRLPAEYQIVLVGTDDTVDKQLPKNIVSIHRTQNQAKLAEIYTAADVFVNPTREEVLGLVNVEALACATPVITFASGGSPECIDETCGSVVLCDDVDILQREIVHVCEEKPYSKHDCLSRSALFDYHDKYEGYMELYCDVMK